MKTPGPLKLSLCLYAIYIPLLVRRTRPTYFWFIFGPKSFFAILLGKIIPKPLLIDYTVYNTSRDKISIFKVPNVSNRKCPWPKALYYSVEYAVLLVIYNLMFVVITINSMLGLC